MSHRKLMTLLSKLHFDDEMRHELIYSWTSGRTSSSKGLKNDELSNLIWKLENDFHFSSNLTPLLQIEKRKKQSQVLAIAQRVGIHQGTDFEGFNRFMLNKSVKKKELYKYNLEELDELIRQFRNIEQNYRASAERPGTKAYNREMGFSEVSGN